MNAQRSTPVINATVSANDESFVSLDETHLLPRPNREGVVLSPSILQHVAYVRIHQSGGSFVNVPLPITEEICDHTLPIVADKQQLAKNDYERNLRFLTQEFQTLSTIQSTVVSQANDLNERKRYEDALKAVQGVVSETRDQLTGAAGMLGELKQQAAALQIRNQKLLELAAAKLEDLQQRNRELSELRTSIENTINKRDAQARADVLVKLGEQAERDADFEEAITRYELALGEQPDQPRLKEKLERLKEQWQTKGPEHEAARELIFEQWGDAEITELESPASGSA